jgi:hypothetical protein
MRPLLAIVLLTLLSGCAASRGGVEAAPVSASTVVPTQLVVHVLTHDAKLIGTAVGGVRITVRDVRNDRVLATGLHEGATGDTRRLVQTPRERGATLFTTSDGARFATTIPLSAPTLVEIAAEGPLGYPDQMARSSKQLTLLPGRHLTGDGLLLEMHGYVIDLLTPDSSLVVSSGARVPVRARVRMLCSCPTGPDQLWQVSEVRARIVRDGLVLHDIVLPHAGAASEYAAELPALTAGGYTLELTAASPDRVTFGALQRALTIR